MKRWKLIAFACAALASAIAGWLVTDALEANNDFCNRCHLPSGAVLHEQIRDGFDAQPEHNLAGVHGSARAFEVPAGRAGEGEGPGRDFRCIDCHGGVGWLGRTKVKLLAAKDAMVWLTGDFDEPDHMEYPLSEADCRQCHSGFALDLDQDIDADYADEADYGPPRFHGLSVHNADLGVTCVECHSVHEGGNDVEMFYLDAVRVRQQCARCHSEYQEGVK